jgi:hypothetical protein
MLLAAGGTVTAENRSRQGYLTPIRGSMDVLGAKMLAARIRAGVRVGTRIELVTVGDDSSGLRIGDCGVVREIVDDGHVVVSWDRGFALEIDPDVNRYRSIAAA